MAVPTHNLYYSYPSLGVSRGWFTNVTYIHKYGHNADVGADWETVWAGGGLYVHPAAATIMQVSSSDVDDTSAGAGARTLLLEGLDANYDSITETVILNGQSQVPTTKSYLRIFRARVQSAGATGWNEGTIYVGTGTAVAGVPPTVYTIIEPLVNNTLQAFYTIPNGFTAYRMQTHISSSVAKQVSAGLFSRTPGGVFAIDEYYALVTGEILQTHYTGESYPQKTDIELRAKAVGGGGDIAAQIELMLIYNG